MESEKATHLGANIMVSYWITARSEPELFRFNPGLPGQIICILYDLCTLNSFNEQFADQMIYL